MPKRSTGVEGVEQELKAQSHTVDTKSSYDALSKDSAASRKDRRSAVEMAFVADSLATAGLQLGGCLIFRCPQTISRRRSWPRPLEHLIKTGHFTLVQEQALMQQCAEPSSNCDPKRVKSSD